MDLGLGNKMVMKLQHEVEVCSGSTGNEILKWTIAEDKVLKLAALILYKMCPHSGKLTKVPNPRPCPHTTLAMFYFLWIDDNLEAEVYWVLIDKLQSLIIHHLLDLAISLFVHIVENYFRIVGQAVN